MYCKISSAWVSTKYFILRFPSNFFLYLRNKFDDKTTKTMIYTNKLTNILLIINITNLPLQAYFISYSFLQNGNYIILSKFVHRVLVFYFFFFFIYCFLSSLVTVFFILYKFIFMLLLLHRYVTSLLDENEVP